MAFDVVRSGIVSQQSYTAVSKELVRDGKVIRCEKQGASWYVDGKLIASNAASGANVAVFQKPGMPRPVPCISVKGSFEITAIGIFVLRNSGEDRNLKYFHRLIVDWRTSTVVQYYCALVHYM